MNKKSNVSSKKGFVSLTSLNAKLYKDHIKTNPCEVIFISMLLDFQSKNPTTIILYVFDPMRLPTRLYSFGPEQPSTSFRSHPWQVVQSMSRFPENLFLTHTQVTIGNIYDEVISQFNNYSPVSLSFTTVNIYTQVMPTPDDLSQPCECKGSDAGKCGEECQNRLMYVECEEDCAGINNCGNQIIRKGTNWPHYTIKQTQGRGFGVFATQVIPKDTFLGEYTGMVVTKTDYLKSNNGKNDYYGFDILGSGFYIDARQTGNYLKYINHSCTPNSETYRSAVDGYERIGFITSKDILPGEELTIKYDEMKSVPVFGSTKCLCDPNCPNYFI